jgi:two-component system response regulator NreC
VSVQPIRVLLVEDHVVVRRGLAALLASLGNFLVVGEAADGEEGTHVFDEVHPDLVLMDLSMPRLNGIEATRRLRQLHPDVHVLILSMHEDEAFVAQALLAGAQGYVVKHSTPEELRLAMETVSRGGIFISPAVARPIVDEYLHRAQNEYESNGAAPSPRELEVLQLIAEGHTTDEIAELLSISPHTAQHHRANLKRKLEARSNADLIRISIEKKLIATA